MVERSRLLVAPAVETTFDTAGVEFQDPKAAEHFPSGWSSQTQADMRTFSDQYYHTVDGALSAVIVFRSGTIHTAFGNNAHGLVGLIGGATSGHMTTTSWSFVDSMWGTGLAKRWAAHEVGHLFGAEHGHAFCAGYHSWTARQHQTIEAATSANDQTPGNCVGWQFWPHYHFRFSQGAVITGIRPHACSIALVCP